jgi:TetR/AcrR family transcriptional regulator
VKDNSKPGRPVGAPGKVRDALVESARRHFLERPYERVGIREIAADAGTSAGMVRYYFGGKKRLYETVLLETLAPILDKMSEAVERNELDLEGVGNVITDIMLENPGLPDLLTRLVILDEGPEKHFFLEDHVEPVMRNLNRVLERLMGEDATGRGFNSEFSSIAVVSLWFHPFMVKGTLEHLTGQPLGMRFFRELLSHNSRLISQALALPPDRPDAKKARPVFTSFSPDSFSRQ